MDNGSDIASELFLNNIDGMPSGHMIFYKAKHVKI